MTYTIDRCKAATVYDKLERILNYCAEEAGIKDLGRYYIPLCQQGDEGSGVSKGSPVKSHKISESKMMEQFARSLQNSSQMVNSIKFKVKKVSVRVLCYPTGERRMYESPAHETSQRSGL